MVACFLVCAKGLQKGVEKITKVMMILLLVLLVVLAVRASPCPTPARGFRFYLKPDFGKLVEYGLGKRYSPPWASPSSP